MLRLCLLIFSFLFGLAAMANPRQLIVDQDGGVDDLAALAMVLLADNVQVKAVTICPADSFKKSAVNSTLGLVRFLKKDSVDVSAGDDIGLNPFPKKWRSDSERLEKLPELSATAPKKIPSAVDRLVELLSKDVKYDILATGPLSNIARAIARQPAIKKNIGRIYVMGGAVQVKGNVKEKGRSQTAEWNIYNNPEAAKMVFESGVPITLVALDATNKTPVTREFMDALKGQSDFAVSKLFYDVWKIIAQQIQSKDYEHTYYFWDTLAAAAIINDKVVKTVPKKLTVSTNGPNQGQTYVSETGNVIDVAVDADPELLQKMILDLFKK